MTTYTFQKLRIITIAGLVTTSLNFFFVTTSFAQESPVSESVIMRRIAIAFSKVVAFNIYKSPVLVRATHSPNGDMTITFEPSDSDGKTKLIKPDKTWLIKVNFPADPAKERDLVVTNKERITATKHNVGDESLGKIVEIASHCLISASHRPNSEGYLYLPSIIKVHRFGRYEEKTSVSFTNYPPGPGQWVLVYVSKDLKHTEIINGE